MKSTFDKNAEKFVNLMVEKIESLSMKSSNRYINKRIMNERTIQIDVIGKIEGTQFMKCKLYTNENIVIIMMNEFDYERLKEEGIFIRDGKSRDSAGVLNTTNTFIEKN